MSTSGTDPTTLLSTIVLPIPIRAPILPTRNAAASAPTFDAAKVSPIASGDMCRCRTA